MVILITSAVADLILSAYRPEEQNDFDTIIRIATPQDGGRIDGVVRPSRPGEGFPRINGLAVDGSRYDFGFSDHKLLSVPFQTAVVGEIQEMTGRPYDVGTPAAAEGIITDPDRVTSAPTISAIDDQTTTTGMATAAIAFTVDDDETAAAELDVTATSDSTTLVPASGIVLGGSGADRTIVLTPAAGQTGMATITVTVSDGDNETATETFKLTVSDITNMPPTISAIANQTTSTGVRTDPILFTVGDAETAVVDLNVTATSNNTTLVPTGGILLGGTGENRTITLTPAAGQMGTATITVTVTDGGGAAANSAFNLTVSNVVTNTPPTISDISDQTTTRGVATPEIPFVVGDAETPAANLNVTATSSNTALVPASGIVLGGSDANRTIVLTPTAGQTGTATITVNVSDAGAAVASDTFNLTVSGSSSGEPVVTISATGPGGDPNPLPGTGGQPTSWALQRSSLRQITIDLPITPTAVTANDVVLTNLGIDARAGGDADQVISTLRDDQLVLDGSKLTINLDAAQLSDGVYQLELKSALTGGDSFTFIGDRDNKFFVLTGDWNGSGAVSVLDFASFSYWFGKSVNTNTNVPPNQRLAPEYVDLNGSARSRYWTSPDSPATSTSCCNSPAIRARVTATTAAADRRIAVGSADGPADVNRDGVLSRPRRVRGDRYTEGCRRENAGLLDDGRQPRWSADGSRRVVRDQPVGRRPERRLRRR